MLKKFLWLVLLAAAGFLAWRFGYPVALKYFFRISGTISVAPGLIPGLPGANGMLFIVARNEDGVPVAVKKIINPVFPARFEMTSSSLIMPDLLSRRIHLEALLNTHGQLGVPRRGDLKGARRDRVNFISKGLEIQLNATEK
ncbi:MAG: hypothetical protein Q7R35_19140 [Elusimicrobiota bacterium]|nr:hypothetical protein [Elusimicrobiota bacterium]